MRNSQLLLLIWLSIGIALPAVGDDWPPIERKLPPKGIALPDAERTQVEAALKELQAALKKLPETDEVSAVQPDVEIYEKAARYALEFGEFYKPGDAAALVTLVQTATQRAADLGEKKHAWTEARGLVVRGYRSELDGSPQPYGLEIPDDVDLRAPTPLYVWLHGRGDQETDWYFIRNRSAKRGQLQPAGAIVLHPFGRHCVGFKSAGEIDVFEAIESVRQRYKIDPERIVLAGFSMGGAGAWHLGAHYADRFVAVHPGAGFVDVAKYLHIPREQYPAEYEEKLWGLYDVPDYVRNLLNVPVIAYSGENDAQKAAADIMVAALHKEGRDIQHIIGPGVGHSYEPNALREVVAQLATATKAGRVREPREVHWQSRTLRYHKLFWVDVQGLDEHWADARVDAELTDNGAVRATTKNVSAVRFDIAAEKIEIDGQNVQLPAPRLVLKKADGKWMADVVPMDAKATPRKLAKQPGLQGPIDDVWMAPFLIVTPSGKSPHPAVERWVAYELRHQLHRWRALMRGEPRVKRDTDVTAEDMQRYNLVLWGDRHSNSLITNLADSLPIKWTSESIVVGARKFDAAHCVPALIYPSPWNPTHYVVLNSGLTFREGHDRTNSLQNPKLPDWAIIDVNTAPSADTPGAILDAGFFDERWQLKPR